MTDRGKAVCPEKGMHGLAGGVGKRASAPRPTPTQREDLTASPVQTFLELSGGDKRDRETADQVRKAILTVPASPATK